MLFLLKCHGNKPGLFGQELQQGSGNISLNEKETYYLIPFLKKKKEKKKGGLGWGGSVTYFLLFVRGHVLSLPVGYCCSVFQTIAAASLTLLLWLWLLVSLALLLSFCQTADLWVPHCL